MGCFIEQTNFTMKCFLVIDNEIINTRNNAYYMSLRIQLIYPNEGTMHDVFLWISFMVYEIQMQLHIWYSGTDKSYHELWVHEIIIKREQIEFVLFVNLVK